MRFMPTLLLVCAVATGASYAGTVPAFIKDAASECDVETLKIGAPFKPEMENGFGAVVRSWHTEPLKSYYSLKKEISAAKSKAEEEESNELIWINKTKDAQGYMIKLLTENAEQARKKATKARVESEGFQQKQIQCQKAIDFMLTNGASPLEFLVLASNNNDINMLNSLLGKGLNLEAKVPFYTMTSNLEHNCYGYPIRVICTPINVPEIAINMSIHLAARSNYCHHDIDKKTISCEYSDKSMDFIKYLLKNIKDVNMLNPNGINILGQYLLNTNGENEELLLYLKSIGATPTSWHKLTPGLNKKNKRIFTVQVVNPGALYKGKNPEIYKWLLTAKPASHKDGDVIPDKNASPRNNQKTR